MISAMPTSNPSESRNGLIIGATSSLGVALCRVLAERGWALCLTGRDPGELQRLADDLAIRYAVPVQMIAADLMDDHFTPEPFAREAEECQMVVMLAGDMGNAEAADTENLRRVTEVNYLRPAQILSAVAARMVARKSGRIVIISSVAGDRGRQSNIAYGSAKAALTTFASGLRNHACAHGVQVTTVKPGFVDTPLTFAMHSPLTADRDEVAREIVDAAMKGRNVIYVPWFWQWIMLAIRHIPEFIFKKLKL
jgi:decaprenylphospho-beta-D-erythro-pentofuranosid-2-ulose 2-reductase